MNDQELDALVAAAGTPRPGMVESLDLGGSATELRELIMTTTDKTLTDIEAAEETLERERARRRNSGRNRGLAMIVVAAAAAAAIVIVDGAVTTSGEDGADRGGGGTSLAYAAELVAVAEAAPRLLVTAEGWSIVRAEEFGIESGELEFSDGDRTVGLFWRPADQHQSYLDDRAETGPARDITLADHPASLFTDSGVTFSALWLAGNHSVEFRGDSTSEGDYLAIAATLEAVDIDTWLAAMPESVIAAQDQPVVFEGVLAEIPLPPGFDPTALGADGGVGDRYSLGAEATGAVACGWLDIWLAADTAGDAVAMDQATQAMASSRTWPILLEMDPSGDYPEAIWDLADALSADGVSPLNGDIRNPEYKWVLGCA